MTHFSRTLWTTLRMSTSRILCLQLSDISSGESYKTIEGGDISAQRTGGPGANGPVSFSNSQKNAAAEIIQANLPAGKVCCIQVAPNYPSIQKSSLINWQVNKVFWLWLSFQPSSCHSRHPLQSIAPASMQSCDPWESPASLPVHSACHRYLRNKYPFVTDLIQCLQSILHVTNGVLEPTRTWAVCNWNECILG